MSRNPHDEMLGSNQSKQSCTSISSNFSQQVFKKLGSKVDLTFNTIKDVKKVTWKDEAPWFREVSDGFCWLGYCENQQLNYTQAI